MSTLAMHMNPRLFFYRWLARGICILMRRPVSNGLSRSVAPRAQEAPEGYWFHAASVGEFEGLLPLIEECAQRGAVAAVSVWSHSGDGALERLRRKWDIPILRAPHEGDWEIQLRNARPTAVIVYRYEAWPDLWASCSELKIPLLLLGARARSSLKWVKRILRVLGVSLPPLGGSYFVDSDRPGLETLFPNSVFQSSVNPRWQRASLRTSGSLSGRALEVAEILRTLPQPLLFLAQVWPSDFENLGLNLASWPGGVVVVPHSLEPESLEKVVKSVQDRGISLRWSDAESAVRTYPETARGLVVNEQGVLAELYRFADRAYVGGGFERGIHSVIEPACAGIPVACGPLRVEAFEETVILRESGQLSILNAAVDWEKWLLNKSDQSGVGAASKEWSLSPGGWWEFLHSQAFMDLGPTRE